MTNHVTDLIPIPRARAKNAFFGNTPIVFTVGDSGVYKEVTLKRIKTGCTKSTTELFNAVCEMILADPDVTEYYTTHTNNKTPQLRDISYFISQESTKHD